MRSYVCAMEEIAKKCATATLFISSANSLSTAPVVISGTPEQKEKYLPDVVTADSFIFIAAGGLIFDRVDEKNKNIYNSWFIHMFADFAIMTIWFVNIA